MSAEPVALDLARVDQIERAGVEGWPPTVVEELADGWILRATPGVDRGRSCHALTPRVRPLAGGELLPALERVRAFSSHHGIRGGLQISPLELHGDLLPGLVARGWEPIWKVWVMTVDRAEALERGARLSSSAGPEAFPWTCTPEADPAWLATWQACEPRQARQVIDALAATVFKHMGERGRFGRLGEVAKGIAVEGTTGEWAGLFSLMVRDGVRGQGLGRRLVLSLLESVSAPNIYLQVTMDNAVALSLYESLGFRSVYSYQHLLAPVGWAGLQALPEPTTPPSPDLANPGPDQSRGER